MEVIYIVVVAISTGMVIVGGTMLTIIKCRHTPTKIVEWKNPAVI